MIVLALIAGAFAYVVAREPEAVRSPTLYLAMLAVLIGISLDVRVSGMRTPCN